MKPNASSSNLPNARETCIHALTQWEESTLFADAIARANREVAVLSVADRAFFLQIFYGVLRNLSALDFLISELRSEPIDPQTRQILRLGLFQIFWMRVPPHAAVNESVNLAGRARSLVNALLRRTLREKSQLQQALDRAPLDIRYSEPRFLIARWRAQFGAENCEALCRWNNEPAQIHLRANLLKTSVSELLAKIPDAKPHPAHKLAISVPQLPADAIARGECYVQDPSTLIACDLLAPQPGERILDACAAPGGKTAYLAQLMENRGELVAADVSPERLDRTRENLARLGVANCQLVVSDWINAPAKFAPQSFDRILIDAPCSNTGVIRRRLDVRWRLQPEDFERMPEKQFHIVRKIAPLLKQGGTLVFSTCSIEPEENRQLAERIARELPELELLEIRDALPFRDQIDGAFAARFIRR